MNAKIHILGMALPLMMFSGVSSAAIIDWTAVIDGSQEVPASNSTATGLGMGTLDTISGLLDWNISWQGLTAAAMHFHGAAAPGSNAGVVVDIGALSGGLTSAAIGSTTITAAQIADLQDGLWYINIHTAAFPGGEIRGQVNVVPVPAAVWLFGSGLLGLIVAARRRKL